MKEKLTLKGVKDCFELYKVAFNKKNLTLVTLQMSYALRPQNL